MAANASGYTRGALLKIRLRQEQGLTLHVDLCSLIEAMDAADKTVLITGASSGIGRAAALRFASGGFRVFGASRRKLANQPGIEMLELDVRDDESVRRCVDEVLVRAGAIDVLINNAGILLHGLFAEETPIEDAYAVFETNLFGVARVTNAVLPGMRRRRQGRVINVGSLAAWVGEPGEAFYSASKHALAGYTEALRHELWPLGIHVSMAEPGAFRTNIYQSLLQPKSTITDYNRSREATRRTMLRAAEKSGNPAKVADLLYRVATARRPRLRYGIGGEAWLPYLKVLIPQTAFDFLLRRGFGLRRPEK